MGLRRLRGGFEKIGVPWRCFIFIGGWHSVVPEDGHYCNVSQESAAPSPPQTARWLSIRAICARYGQQTRHPNEEQGDQSQHPWLRPLGPDPGDAALS